MDNIDIKATKDDLLSQLEKVKKEGKIEKAKPKSNYVKKMTLGEKVNKLLKNKVYGETDLLK
jgi:hypothetical protein